MENSMLFSHFASASSSHLSSAPSHRSPSPSAFPVFRAAASPPRLSPSPAPRPGTAASSPESLGSVLVASVDEPADWISHEPSSRVAKSSSAPHQPTPPSSSDPVFSTTTVIPAISGDASATHSVPGFIGRIAIKEAIPISTRCSGSVPTVAHAAFDSNTISCHSSSSPSPRQSISSASSISICGSSMSSTTATTTSALSMAHTDSMLARMVVAQQSLAKQMEKTAAAVRTMCANLGIRDPESKDHENSYVLISTDKIGSKVSDWKGCDGKIMLEKSNGTNFVERNKIAMDTTVKVGIAVESSKETGIPVSALDIHPAADSKNEDMNLEDMLYDEQDILQSMDKIEVKQRGTVASSEQVMKQMKEGDTNPCLMHFLVAGAAPKVFDAMSVKDVVWDEEIPHDLDLHEGILQQLAQGEEFWDDQKEEPVVQEVNGEVLTHVGGLCLFLEFSVGEANETFINTSKEAVRDVHSICLSWTLPCLHKEYMEKPEDYLARLFGQEGKGSLLYFLKAKGWAGSLSAGVGSGGAQPSSYAYIFEMSIRLTDSGLKNLYKVITVVYQYIKLLKQSREFMEFRFKELQDIGYMEFRLAGEQPPDDYAVDLAENMLFCSEKHSVCGEYNLEVWDPDLGKHALSFFHPDNMRVDILSKSFDKQSQAIQYEPWFGPQYIAEDIPSSLIESWGNPAQIDANFYLSQKNEFIPRDITRDFGMEQKIKFFYDIKGLSDFKANPDYKGICHIALAQEGHYLPGFLMGIGKATLKVPPTIRLVLEGEMPPYLFAKDLILQIMVEISVSGATCKSKEFLGSTVESLNTEEHMTLCNMLNFTVVELLRPWDPGGILHKYCSSDLGAVNRKEKESAFCNSHV